MLSSAQIKKKTTGGGEGKSRLESVAADEGGENTLHLMDAGLCTSWQEIAAVEREETERRALKGVSGRLAVSKLTLSREPLQRRSRR